MELLNRNKVRDDTNTVDNYLSSQIYRPAIDI